jgi:hypothetical protein
VSTTGWLKGLQVTADGTGSCRIPGTKPRRQRRVVIDAYHYSLIPLSQLPSRWPVDPPPHEAELQCRPGVAERGKEGQPICKRRVSSRSSK